MPVTAVFSDEVLSSAYETLMPTLRTEDIVVMGNMRSHHVKAVGDLLRQNGMIPLYLPPYSQL